MTTSTEILQGWHIPTQIVTGRGAMESLANSVPALGNTTLVVTDANVRATGLVDHVRRLLAMNAVRSEVIEVEEQHPKLATVAELADHARSARLGVLIAVGGGRCMDVAKAAALHMRDPKILDPQSEAWSGDSGLVRPAGQPFAPSAPCLAVPTTVGTGSEVSSVVSLMVNGTKRLVVHPSLRCHSACLDPEATEAVPSAVLLAGAFEAWSRSLGMLLAGPELLLQDVIASAICSVLVELGDAVASGDRSESVRLQLSLASAQTHTSFQNIGRSATGYLLWYIANEVAVTTKTTKVAALAALTPAMLALETTAGLSRLGDAVGLDNLIDKRDVCSAVTQMLKRWNLPTSLADISREPIDMVALMGSITQAWGDVLGAGRLPIAAAILDNALGSVGRPRDKQRADARQR